MSPTRIQRKRTKGWRMPPNTVFVGRPTKWGNPFNWQNSSEPRYEAHAFAVELYRHFITNERGPSAPTDEDIASLRGKNLACWCSLDEHCHADVLLELANA